MLEHENLRKRVLVLENVVRYLMAIVIETMPPRAAENIDRLGWEWNKELDSLDAELKAEAASTENGQRGSGGDAA
jgi:hypothetical protein